MPLINLPKYTFINGPPGSGKSTLAEMLCKQDPSVCRESFANPIREMMYGVFYPNEGPISFSFDLRNEDIKSRPMEFQPKEGAIEEITNRAAMISFSEKWMKPVFGEDIFGRLLFARCKEQEDFYERFIIDDSGFKAEAEYIISQVGHENCHLIRLHREGCNFSSDSRSHIYLDRVQSLDLHNDGPPDTMLDLIALEMGNL